MIPNDIPSLNYDLGETADMLRDAVRSFSADEIAPRAAEIDRSNEFPMDSLVEARCSWCAWHYGGREIWRCRDGVS